MQRTSLNLTLGYTVKYFVFQVQCENLAQLGVIMFIFSFVSFSQSGGLSEQVHCVSHSDIL